MNRNEEMTMDEALSFFDGNKSALARALGSSKQNLNNWKGDDLLPEKYTLKLIYKILPAMAQEDGDWV